MKRRIDSAAVKQLSFLYSVFLQKEERTTEFLFPFIHWCRHCGILPDIYFDRSTGLIRGYCVVHAMLSRSSFN